jgi:branched-chain amino acid transport system substrate-binding protein
VKKRLLCVLGLITWIAASTTLAEKKYGPGVTDSEILLGQTMPYSGPASAFGTIGRAEAAYFKMINDQGGINGRKIRLISLDDGYSPPKTVEQTRRLVELERVLAIFSPLGTPTNSATHKYLNTQHVPQLLLHSSANKWNDPANFPWSMSWPPNSHTETQIVGKYLLNTRTNAMRSTTVATRIVGRSTSKPTSAWRIWRPSRGGRITTTEDSHAPYQDDQGRNHQDGP